MRLLYLSILSFVFISAITLDFSSEKEEPPALKVINESTSSVPVLKERASFPIISAQSVFAVDLESGANLYEKMPDKLQLPASTAKIVTALVSLDYYPLDSSLKVDSVNVAGQKMGLVQGEEIMVEDLLYGLLIYSANDAAEALAQNFPGGRDLFVAAMNLKASQLDLANSYFVNPAGLDGVGQHTTARDLVAVAAEAMKDERIVKIVGTKQKEVKSVDGLFSHKLVNLNELVGEVEGVLGVKTGWTENARENLVTYIKRDGNKVMIALLGSQDRFGETKEIIEWIFNNYSWEEVSFQQNYSSP